MPNTSTTKILRPARQAVFYALRRWDRWTSQINTFVESDDDVKRFLQVEPNVSRCPMVSAAWATFDPSWWVFTMQRWQAPLEIAVWVPEDRASLAEDLIEDAIDAVYRFPHQSSSNAAPVSHVAKVIAESGGKATMILAVNPGTPVAVGEEQKHRMIRSSVVIRFELQKDPMLRASA